MITAGVSYSAWASPVVLPLKKNGGHRFCVDFWKVNAVTETDTYCILSQTSMKYLSPSLEPPFSPQLI